MDHSGKITVIAMSSDLVFVREQQSGSVSRGPVFSFIMALKAVNDQLLKWYPESKELFEVLLIDDNSLDSLRTTIRHHELEELITPLSVSEEDLFTELSRNRTQLYLSTEKSKVRGALRKGIAAAVVRIPAQMEEVPETELRVAFDGDAVIFSNESELVFKRGLADFLKHEEEHVEVPMEKGPLAGFLESLESLKKKLHAKGSNLMRTYLVTSRSAGCDGYRALNTLHRWGLEMDEAVFLGGTRKGPTLKRIKPHIFFDDQVKHVNAAVEVGTLACLVPDNAN